jgi:Winged helix-turn-helix DNA-binding
MHTADLTEAEIGNGSMLEEIRKNAEHRLKEIAPLIEEAERLRDVLSVIKRQAPRTALADQLLETSAPSQRAPKGANKRIIMELVERHPGITAAEISQTTGVKRTVVASTVSRLKRGGELEAAERGGVRVASSRRAAA